MSNLPTYHGMPALTPRKPTISMCDKIAEILEEYLPHPSDDEYRDAADAILVAFTVTERK
jgi:hypothetical protein